MTAIFWTRGRSFCVCSEKPHKQCCKKQNTCNLCIHSVHPLPRVGMGELTSFPWRNGGQITAYRWYRQRAEKSYFFPVIQDSIDSDRLQQKNPPQHCTHRDGRKRILGNTGTDPIITQYTMIISPVLGFAYPFLKR